MLITPADISALAADAQDAEEQKVKDAVGDLTVAALAVANKEDVLLADRAQLLHDATDVLQGTYRGIVPGQAPTLAVPSATPVAALGAGTTDVTSPILDRVNAIATAMGRTPEDALDLFELLITGVMSNPATRNAKATALMDVANGSVPLNTDGSIDHSSETAPLEAQIRTLQTEKTAAERDRDAAVANLAPVERERDQARNEKAALQAIFDSVKAAVKAAHVTIPVRGRGNPDINAIDVNHLDPTVVAELGI